MDNKNINMERLQNVAMLNLDKSEINKFLIEIEYFLKLADEIKQVDLSNISDDLDFSFTNNEFREDINDFDTNIDITNICPDSYNGYIVVPKILD